MNTVLMKSITMWQFVHSSLSPISLHWDCDIKSIIIRASHKTHDLFQLNKSARSVLVFRCHRDRCVFVRGAIKQRRFYCSSLTSLSKTINVYFYEFMENDEKKRIGRRRQTIFFYLFIVFFIQWRWDTCKLHIFRLAGLTEWETNSDRPVF